MLIWFISINITDFGLCFLAIIEADVGCLQVNWHPFLLLHLFPSDRSPPPLVSPDPSDAALYYYGNGG